MQSFNLFKREFSLIADSLSDSICLLVQILKHSKRSALICFR